MTGLHPWRNISQQDTNVESVSSLWCRLSLLGLTDSFWGPLRASEASSSCICVLRAESLSALPPSRIWVGPGILEVGSFPGQQLSGWWEVSGEGRPLWKAISSLHFQNLLLERTPALGSGRVAVGKGCPVLGEDMSPLTSRMCLCLLIPLGQPIPTFLRLRPCNTVSSSYCGDPQP